MRPPRRRRQGTTKRQDAWNHSPACAEAARTGCLLARRARAAAPKCGARRKSDGEPCQNLGLENGRCARHGGKTGRGAAWHQIQWPNPYTHPAKWKKKAREVERRRQRLAARVAAMTPEERERYEARSRAMRPGSVSSREAARRDREARDYIQGLLREEKPAAPESAARAAKIAALEKRRAELQAIINAPERIER